MKTLIAALALVLLGSLAQAQETLSFPTSAGQQARVDRDRLRRNAGTCARFSTTAAPLTATCTQADACVNAGAVGGASCTAVQARAANAEIFADSTAGRSTFVQQVPFRNYITDTGTSNVAEDRPAYCVWWNTVASGAQQAADCTKAGRPATCEMCQ